MSIKKRVILQCKNPNCGKDFEVQYYRRNAKYCCKECYTEASKTELNLSRKRINIICPVCQKQFEVQQSAYNGINTCCSHKCATKLLHIEGKIPKREITKKKLCNCLNCDKEYEIWNYRSQTNFFCSNECFNEYRNDELVCPICGKTFNSPKYEKRTYCSQECAKKQVRISNFQKIISRYLKYIEVEFEMEYFIKFENKKLFADFFIPEFNLIIECNGDYWHCNPSKYKGDFYHKQIKKTASEIWKKDEMRINKLKSQNYDILVLWESDKFFKEKINDKVYKN